MSLCSPGRRYQLPVAVSVQPGSPQESEAVLVPLEMNDAHGSWGRAAGAAEMTVLYAAAVFQDEAYNVLCV